VGATGDGVGETITSGARLEGLAAGLATDDDAGITSPGSRPVEPKTGARGSRTALEDAA
jgi:hypothetical protein